LPELGPVVLRKRHVDDAGRGDEVRWQLTLRRLEVLGTNVCRTRVTVAKSLDEHVFVRMLEAARPVEPQAAWLGARRRREGGRALGQTIRVLGTNGELGGDEDHRPR